MSAAPTTAAPTRVARVDEVFAAAHRALDDLDRELDRIHRAAGSTGAPGGGRAAPVTEEPPVGAAELASVMTRLARVANRAQALRDKGGAIVVRSGVPERQGAKDPAQWFTRVLHTDPRTARGDARRAAALDLAEPARPASEDDASSGARLTLIGAEGSPGAGSDGSDSATGETSTSPGGSTPSGPTPTGRAQLSGDLSAAHADVITRALRNLPDGLDPAARERCETELLRMATTRSPVQLRRAAARVIEHVTGDTVAADVHEDRLAQAEEDAAWERASFWMKDNHDGTMFGQFTVPTLAGTALKKIVEAMSAPRRAPSRRAGGGTAGGAGDQSTTDGTGGSRGQHGSDAPGGDRPSDRLSGSDWAQMSWKERQQERMRRQGQELATLLMHLPTDHLHDKIAATVIVQTRLTDLQSQTRRIGTDDSGCGVSAAAVRRAACGAGILPAVMGGDSVPLDLGTQRRCFSETQRAALALTYGSCAAEGCDTPFAWTETHHLRAFAAGGQTDLANAVPLCGHHHRLIDRADEHTISRDPASRRVSIRFLSRVRR